MLLKASIFCSNLFLPRKTQILNLRRLHKYILQRTKNRCNVWFNSVSKSIWALEVHLLTNCTIQAPWSCSLKINYLWRKNIKTLNFLILHKSNTKKHFETKYSVESLMLTPKFKVALLCLILCVMAEGLLFPRIL